MEKKKKKHTKSILNNRIFQGLIALGGAIYTPWKVYKTVKTNVVEGNATSEEENTIGYSDIGAKYNTQVHTNNFVILHVQNKQFNDITALREKLEKCTELDISVGIVLDTNADNLAQMYQDVDFLQAIIKDYKIDLPIYCNIDGIMTNKKLNNAERTTLINAFVDKASRSDMYLGLYGTDTNLCDCKNYDIFDISLYDCYLVCDRDETQYDGMTTITEDREGNIKASSDIAKVINRKNLNSSTKLVLTAKYEVKEGDTIHSLGLHFGLSDEDLMTYNNIKKEVKAGDIIYIPNLYKTVNQETNEVSYSYAIARGIDISDYQTDIDWERVAETSDYVIVEVARDNANYEVNQGTYIDEAINQIDNVLQQDLELGLYFCISKDMKVSVYEERLDGYLSKLDKDLEARNIKLDKENVPVFLDFEIYYENNDYYRLMKSFETICQKHGFCNIGIYGNKSTLDAINGSLKKDEEKISLKDTGWYVWKSGGPQYSGRENTSEDNITLDQITEIKNESGNGYTPVMMQVTNVCTDTGASNSMQHCDVSYLYDYEVFGEDFEEKMNGPILEEETMELVGSLEVDLNNYRNVPVNKIFQVVDSTIGSLYTVLAVCIIGKKVCFKIGKLRQEKRLAKKR